MSAENAVGGILKIKINHREYFATNHSSFIMVIFKKSVNRFVKISCM